jgi:uncharacterized metal-binding protein
LWDLFSTGFTKIDQIKRRSTMPDCCKKESNLIYACSGAADVGEIADRVARRLRTDGVGPMSCLAGIGAGLSGYVQSAKGVGINITVDGCQVACAKKILEKIGVTPTSYILTDMGLVKGKTPVTEKIIVQMSEKIKNAQDTPVIPIQMGTGACSCSGKG